MKDHKQRIREMVLEKVKHKPMDDKLLCMNLIETILSTDHSPDKIIKMIENDKLPKFYKKKGR